MWVNLIEYGTAESFLDRRLHILITTLLIGIIIKMIRKKNNDDDNE
jgi:hypothetical protein